MSKGRKMVIVQSVYNGRTRKHIQRGSQRNFTNRKTVIDKSKSRQGLRQMRLITYDEYIDYIKDHYEYV